MSEGHQNLIQQLSLFDVYTHESPGGADLDVSFLHRSFCLAGLPIREPKEATFSRADSRFSLTISGNHLVLPGNVPCRIGVPWGPKARLGLVWLTTQAQDHRRRPDDRWIEIGPIKDWLAQMGIAANGNNLPRMKDQLIRLAFANFTMILKDGSGTAPFKNDRLVEGGVMGDGDLEAYARGDIAHVRWPAGLLLTDTASTRFRENGIPIPTSRLARIANNAMAIDIFVLLCYRCPTVPTGDSLRITWRELNAHFGSSEHPSKFRERFTDSIRAALNAYPEARVELTGEGLVLHHSDPADLRRAFYVVPSLPDAQKPRRRSSRRLERGQAVM